jgi:hypothetical protein
MKGEGRGVEDLLLSMRRASCANVTGIFVSRSALVAYGMLSSSYVPHSASTCISRLHTTPPQTQGARW